MSEFPWEQASQKKEGESNTDPNAVTGKPPFAAGPIPDLFQKAFSGDIMQEAHITPPVGLAPVFPPSAGPTPLFSMRMPELAATPSYQDIPADPTPSFSMGESQESLPPFISPAQPMISPKSPFGEAKDGLKVQTAKKKPLPLFEMALPDDQAKNNNSIAFQTGYGDKPMENPTFLPFVQQAPVFEGVAQNMQNAISAAVFNPPVSSAQPLISPIQPVSFSNSDSPLSALRNPFGPGNVSSSVDPFSVSGNPFGTGVVPPGPIPAPSRGSPFPGSVMTGPGKERGISGKVADVSKDIARSIEELASSLFMNLRNLTKGKSLMEKIDKIREGNMQEKLSSKRFADGIGSKNGKKQGKNKEQVPASVSSPLDLSPFGSSPFGLSAESDGLSSDFGHGMIHAQGSANNANALSSPPFQFQQSDRAEDHVSSNTSSDFVKVTPVENPLYDFPEFLKIESNPLPPLSANTNNVVSDSTAVFSQGICNVPPVFSLGEQENPANEMQSLSSIKQRPSSSQYQQKKLQERELSFEGNMGSDYSGLVESKDLEDIREKLELSTGNISQVYEMFEGLSGNVNVLGDSVQSLQNSSANIIEATGMKFDNLDERVGRVESRLSGIEQMISNIQSENQDFMSSLSDIEQHISELVESYTVLISKMQENAQEADERLSGLSDKLELIGNLVPNWVCMEKSGTELSAGVQGLTGNVSKLATDVSVVSASQQQMRDEMTELSRYVEGELKKIGARGYKTAGQSIQLTHIMKNSSSIKLCMEWLEFLMELAGRNNLPEILSYYEELCWITEDVRMELMKYAEGIDFYMEKPDWKLTPDDHVKSIWFIENLAGLKVDKNRLSVIDRDIEKVRKSSEIYNI